MKQNKKTLKSSKKNGSNVKILAMAIALTGACGTLFYGISNSVLAAELGREEKIPTSYIEPQKFNAVKTEASTERQNYKANYKIIEETQYFENNKVSENELSKEEAAQIGASFIHQLYDVDLNNTYIYMGYMTGTQTFPRGFWSGDIRFSDAKRKPDDTMYNFMLDSVTGEIFTASFTQKLDEKVPLGYDAALAKNNSIYADTAMKFVKEKGLLGTEPVKVEYGGQGYQGNDPDITFLVYGANGQKVNVNFSRYNKRFKGMISQAYFNIVETPLVE